MAIENVNQKPAAASAALADYLIASIGGKVRRVPISTLADILSAAQIAAIKAASDDLVEEITGDAQDAADRAEAAATRLETFLNSIATDVSYDKENFLLTLVNEAGAQIGSGAKIEAGLSTLTMEVVKGEDGSNYLVTYGADGSEICRAQLPAGGGGGSDTGSVIRITNKMSSRSFTVMDTAETATISYNVTSTDSETSAATGDLTEEWYVGTARVLKRTVKQGDNSLDVKPYLTAGAQNIVKVSVEDNYGTVKTFSWTVTLAAYSLTWNLENFGNHGAEAFSLRLVPNGTGDKVVKVSVDGTSIYSETISTTGRAVAITVPAQTHGAHTVLAWMEVTVDGETIETKKLRHVGIWVEADSTTPIVAFYEAAVSVPRLSTANVMFTVYDPASENAAIVRSVVNGSESASLTVDRTPQTWAFRPTAVGKYTLRVVCGTAYATCEVTATALNYNIQPVTRSLSADLDPSGHSNAEANRASFGYADGSGTNHALTFSSNFDWVNGGFQLDENGTTALVIKKGTSITFDRSLFNDDAKTNGKAMKMIFAVKECRKGNTEIAHCKAAGIGLSMQAHQATLSSELKSITALYCENKKIEMDINIESSSENKFAMFWLEGIPSRATAYSAADNWTQANPELFAIGSADCDIWLYRFKLYSSSLTRYEIMDNYVADCSDPDEMIARYLRNDIYNTDGTINRQKLSTANPELRVLHITAERMTTSKSDEVPCSVELLYGNGGEDKQFTATGVKMKAQGTSSLEYILAALNLDLDFKGAAWSNGSGETIAAYAMTENSIPVNYFNVKLNVASSENANNVCGADDYNAFQPTLSAARETDARVRDTVEGHPCAVFFTNSSSAAITAGARTIQPGETIFYGAGDMNNSKKNLAVFGQDNGRWANQCCVEIMNNNNPQCLFKSDDLSTETWDGGNFEFRFPKVPTDAMKARWQQLLSWVVSTDRSAATDADLDQPVTYDGVAYAKDTAAYRAAKFRAEVYSYFREGTLEYHYLFTERHLMPDNRAKNCFVSYEFYSDINAYRWNFSKDYDNDTLSGNDNSGGMTFTYGMEDTDMVGAAYVFNAHDSVLWCNVRDCLHDKLVSMFLSRESAGAWSATRKLAKWKNYQSTRPEALYAEDAWAKYLSPYIYAGESRFLDMCYGTKEDQLRQFETDQEAYIASKYGGSVSTADRISLRTNAPEEWTGVEPDGDISAIVPYSDVYITVKYGNAGTVRIRAKANQTYNVQLPEGASLNDLETYIYSASRLSSIGSLAALYTKFAEIGAATRLKQMICGSGEVGYANTSMNSITFGQNAMMERIDLRGNPNLEKDLDLSALTSLEELYTEGSGVTGVTFARNSPVKIAKLGSIKTLIARDLTKINTFSVGNTLQSLWVENCPAIDTKAICTSCANLARGRLIGVDWELSTADLLLRLAAMTGFDANGDTVTKFVLTGTALIDMLSQDELETINAAFPELTVTYNTLLSTFTVTFKNYDGTVLDTQRVRQFGAAANPVTSGKIPAPTKPSTVDKVFTYSAWDKGFSYVTSDLVVTAVFTDAPRTYTVKWWNGLTLLETATVEVYDNAIYSGDIPTRSANDIFTGWDVTTTNVQADIDAHAVFETAAMPATKVTEFDYLYSDDPSDNSAYTLGELLGIINSGSADEWFSLGDKIKIVTPTSAFTDTSVVLAIIGFNHFRLADGTAMAETVWHMIGAMSAPYKHHTTNVNTGGWAQSDIRTYLNETVFKNLPIHWQALIKTVQVKSSIGGLSAEISTSQDKLFLLSSAEVNSGDASAVPYKNEIDADAEKATFAVFTDNNSRIRKTFNGEGSAVYWWLRSPDPSSATNFRYVHSNGNVGANGASGANSLAWGFCI